MELNQEDLWTEVENHPTLFLHESIDWEFPNLDQKLPPIQIMSINASDPHFFEILGEHFKTMTQIEKGLWSSIGSIGFLAIILTPLICFCICPNCLRKLVPNFCSDCCFKKIDNKIFNDEEIQLGLALLRANQNDQIQTPSAPPSAPRNDLPISPDIQVVRQLFNQFQMEPITQAE